MADVLLYSPHALSLLLFCYCLFFVCVFFFSAHLSLYVVYVEVYLLTDHTNALVNIHISVCFSMLVLH